ncbi:MAG: ABC transporter permease [Actinomycetes bacterium]
MKSMIIKEFRELSRDRRTMAMIIVLPILFLVIFGYAANFNVGTLKTIVIGPQASVAQKMLPPLFEVTSVLPGATTEQAKQMIVRAEAQVVIDTTTNPPTAWVDGADLFSAQTANAALARSGGQVRTDVLFNPEFKTSWYMVPSLIGLILTFIGTIVTSIGLVRERENGTLEQLAVMPFRPVDVILGKIAPYFLLASIDLLIITVVGILLFGVPFAGSVLVFALGAALFLFVVLGMGVLISTLSQTTGQAIQLAILTLLPQVLLSGMIFPLIAMPWAIRWIGYLMPLTYFTMISRGVFLRGTPIDATAMWLPILVLAVMATVIFSLAIIRFRRDLAPRRSSRISTLAQEA